MSRPRNFPETIYVGMNRKGDVYLIPDKDPVLFITTTGICKTMSYRINSFYCKLALKASKPDPTPEAMKPRKPRNQLWKCPSCKWKGNDPLDLPLEIQEAPFRREGYPRFLCPECMSVIPTILPKDLAVVPKEQDNQLESKPEVLPTALETESRPKRHRRTKTEIEVAKKAEKKLAKQMREVPLDKPKWKCPDDNCGWMGNAPPRAIMGINTSKLICPECKMVVLKNE
jgi:hypothetical protein